MMFIFIVLDQKNDFLVNLVQKLKIVSLKRNLMQRLTQICKIQW